MNKIKVKCQEQIFQDYHRHPCSHNAKVKRDGKWYCGTHDPVRITEKKAVKDAEWDKAWARARQQDERRNLMCEILKDKTMDELRKMAKETI